MDAKQVDVMVADASHEVYVDKILDTIREAAKVRGTGIAERTHEYVATKMREGKAIIALCGEEFIPIIVAWDWQNALRRRLSDWRVYDGRKLRFSV